MIYDSFKNYNIWTNVDKVIIFEVTDPVWPVYLTYGQTTLQ